MLSDIHSVDWAALGKWAEGIPEVFGDLFSDDAETRNMAHYSLGEITNHQGSVFEAAIYVIPFLIELLHLPEIQDKNRILHRLGCLSQGQSVDDSQDWNVRAHEAVYQGLPVYLPLLKHPDPKIRKATLFLLSRLQEDEDNIAPCLFDLLQEEDDDEVLTHIAETLGNMAFSDEYWQQERNNTLIYLFESNRPSVIGAIAAKSLLVIAKEDTPDNVLSYLIRVIRYIDNYISEDWPAGDLVTDICWTGLSYIDVERRVAVLIEMVAHMDEVRINKDWDGYKYTLSWVLLNAVFPYPEKFTGSFTAQQRLAIQTILDREIQWEGVVDSRVTDTHNLPASRAEMLTLLQVSI